MKGCVSSTYPLGDFPPGLDTLLSGEDKRFMGSSPFEFGSANLDANGELGRFRGSLVVSADSMESTSKNLELNLTKDTEGLSSSLSVFRHFSEAVFQM